MRQITTKEWEAYLKVREILIRLDIEVNDQDRAGVELLIDFEKTAWTGKGQALATINNVVYTRLSNR